MYDISQVGYQQFDMIDSFNLFENPNELPQHEIDDGDLRELYGVSICFSLNLTFFL